MPQTMETVFRVNFPFDEACESAEDAAGRVMDWSGRGVKAEAVRRVERVNGLEVARWVCVVIGMED